MTTFELPSDPLARFRELYDELNRDASWLRGNTAAYRFTAIVAVTIPGPVDDVARRIQAAAHELKERAGWFDGLRNSIRFIVSAVLVLHDDTPAAFLDEVDRVRSVFRDRNLRRGGFYETMAILALRTQAALAPIPEATVIRFQALYEEMKKHHWWLTGPDDFPACAVLSNQEASVSEIGGTIERIYQALHARGFKKGDPLQTASNILYLARKDPEDIARRYHALATGFRERNVRIWQSDYDEIAILTMLDAPEEQIIARVLDVRAEVETLRPKPDASVSFNLAASIAFLETAQTEHLARGMTDAKALTDMYAVLQAQQAAVMASVTAATSSAAAASG